MSEACLFCKIVSGAIQSQRIYEDADFICINDIQPQAKTHLLVIPKKHIATLEEAFRPDQGFPSREHMGRLLEVGVEVARQQKLLPDGFRAVVNTNRHGGQTVYHLHLHILGGEQLKGAFA